MEYCVFFHSKCMIKYHKQLLYTNSNSRHHGIMIIMIMVMI